MIESTEYILVGLGDRLCVKFENIAKKHNTTPQTVLKNYALDYIVSDGHPEKVNRTRPDLVLPLSQHKLDSSGSNSIIENENAGSKYVFYVDNMNILSKKYAQSKDTDECFSIIPYHDKEAILGWTKNHLDLSKNTEIPFDLAMQKLREEIEWRVKYYEVKVTEQRVLELVLMLAEGDNFAYWIEAPEDRILRYVREGKYYEAKRIIQELQDREMELRFQVRRKEQKTDEYEASLYKEYQVGTTVYHPVYGEGTITKFDGRLLDVQFDQKEASFVTPTCIETGIIRLGKNMGDTVEEKDVLSDSLE